MRSNALLVSHHLAFAEPAHDRLTRRGIRPWWDGRDNGRKIDFELKDCAADGEAPELWTTSVTGDLSGRKQIDPPFTAFTFRTDHQPVGGVGHVLGLTESRRRPSAADRTVRGGGGEAERGVPRGLSRRTARGGMPCGGRSRWVPATGTGAFVRSIR
ncbi:carbohydrate binding domain-containing protein [Streptomyces chartreusis]